MKTFKVLFYYGESAGISVTADSCEEAKKSVEKWLKEYARLEPPGYIEAASYKISESLDTDHTAYLFKNNWNTVNPEEKSNIGDTQLLSIAEIIVFAKDSLGLPNKDIASILRVTRQTLHTYKDANTNQTLNFMTMKRAMTINDVMKKIAPKFRRSLGAMAKNFTFEGESLLQLLESDELNVDKIVSLADKLSESMNSVSHSNSINNDTLHSLTRAV